MSLQRPLSLVLCCEGPADELVDGGAVYCVEDNEGQADVHGRMPLGERGGLDGRGRLDGRVELVGRRGVDGRVGLEGHAASPGACTSSAVPMLGVDPARRESDPAESVWFVAGQQRTRAFLFSPTTLPARWKGRTKRRGRASTPSAWAMMRWCRTAASVGRGLGMPVAGGLSALDAELGRL